MIVSDKTGNIRKMKDARKEVKRNFKGKRMRLKKIEANQELTAALKTLQEERLKMLTKFGLLGTIAIKNRNKYSKANTNHKAKHLRGN